MYTPKCLEKFSAKGVENYLKTIKKTMHNKQRNVFYYTMYLRIKYFKK